MLIYASVAFGTIVVALALFPPRALLDKFCTDGGPRFYFRTRHKAVAITVDDSPNPESTQRILAILRKNGARATFFVIGDQAKKCPGLVKQILGEGHEIGNHDISNRRSVSIPTEQLLQDVKKTHEIISSLGGAAPKWFRFGCGTYTREKLRALSRLGYTSVLGDSYSFDPHIPFPLWVTAHTLLRVQPGSIVIVHDGTWWRGINTSYALGWILPILRWRGYVFLTLSQLEELERNPRCVTACE